MLDLISEYRKNRDCALDWLKLYTETGLIGKDEGDFLAGVLNGQK